MKDRRTSTRSRFVPSPADVDELIGKAENHPLGTQFLMEGALDAVAATFGTHAFTVTEARGRLAAPRVQTETAGH